MACASNDQALPDMEKLVRPKIQLQTLLQQAGAAKDLFTMKEVMFYLGKYIMTKQLYDQQQQHIVHCGGDALGDVLGVETFSVKEPRILFSMITKNLTAVTTSLSTESQPLLLEPNSLDQSEGQSEDSSDATTSTRRRRRSSDPAGSSREEEPLERRKRRKSESLSLTFDDSLSWCVIGGLHSSRRSSESTDPHTNAEVGTMVSDDSDVNLSDEDSDSDNFSVEFEVESIDSDVYSDNDEASVPGEDEVSESTPIPTPQMKTMSGLPSQIPGLTPPMSALLFPISAQVYEVTIFGPEEEDSFDQDTEISEADYWKCPKCEELNPPLPRNCNRCWALRTDWLPEAQSSPVAVTVDTPAAKAISDLEEGLDMPDGKRTQPLSPLLKEETALMASQTDSQASSCSQPSTSSAASSSVLSSQEEAPELERFNSLDSYSASSSLDPCVICQSRPKNGSIVHGRTAHLMACYVCAKKLKNRNKLCPVCREPIQSVVLTYIS